VSLEPNHILKKKNARRKKKAKLAEEETQEVQEGYFDENMEICS